MLSVEVLLLVLLAERLLTHCWSAIKWARNRKALPSQPSPNPKRMDLETQAHSLLKWEQKLKSWEASLTERQTLSPRSSKPLKPPSARSWQEL